MRVTCSLFLSALLASPNFAQSSAQSPQEAKAPQPVPADSRAASQAPESKKDIPALALTNKDVLEMLKAGLTQKVVIAKIKSSTCDFDTSPGTLKELKAASVPDAVVLAMVQAPVPSKAPAVPKASARTNDGLSLQECESLGASLNKILSSQDQQNETRMKIRKDAHLTTLKVVWNCADLASDAQVFELSSGLYKLSWQVTALRVLQLNEDNAALINAHNQLLAQAQEYAASVQEYVAGVQNWMAAQQTQPSSVQLPLTRWQRFRQGLAAWAEAQAEYQRQHPTVTCHAQTYPGGSTEMTCQ